jgi:hypothetical protein
MVPKRAKSFGVEALHEPGAAGGSLSLSPSPQPLTVRWGHPVGERERAKGRFIVPVHTREPIESSRERQR